MSVEPYSNALSDLRTLLNDLTSARPLIVGHNIWLHDLPIIREQLNCHLEQFGPIWDTLWIDVLLRPGKKMYALVHSERPHEADYDTKAASELCWKHWQSLPDTLPKHLANAWDRSERNLLASLASVRASLNDSSPPMDVVPSTSDELVAAGDLEARLW